MQKQFDAVEVARFENETWSRCAKGYIDGFGALVAEGIEPLLDELKLSKGDRVLDVGTGPGLVAAVAAKRGANPIGLDFSETMLTEARRVYPDIEFRAGSGEALPFGDNAFDVVVGNFVLHHSGAPDKVMTEAFRVLHPGGRMGFTVWADPSKLEAFGLFFAAVEEHAGGLSFRTARCLGSAISRYFMGWQPMRAFGIPRSARYRSHGERRRWIRSWLHFGIGPTWRHFRVTCSVRSKAACGSEPRPIGAVKYSQSRTPRSLSQLSSEPSKNSMRQTVRRAAADAGS